jgi:hypothetical protein
VKRRIAWRLLFGTTSLTVSDGTQLKTWVSKETKERFSAVARYQGMSDSALLKRLVELMLQTASSGGLATIAEANRTARGSRLTVRLRTDDQALLLERAAARGMAAATYVSVLVRSHLRALPPLPKSELAALKHAVSELSAVGRNLNQIARAANEGARIAGAGRDEFKAILKICEALRDHTKNLIKANAASWASGHAEPES